MVGLIGWFDCNDMPPRPAAMRLRIAIIAALATVFVAVLAPAGAFAKPYARPGGDDVAPIAFALVKGDPDACGPGCDSWIAAEGKIDTGAAARFRTFMQRIGTRDLPVYLHSPGGNLDEALAIGTLLRERKALVRVGRTMIRECGFEAQDGAVCAKLKQSGRELQGEVWTRGGICNSACPYLLLGATRRDIAPDAVLGVHSPHVILNFTGGLPPPDLRARALQRVMSRADAKVSAYLKRMGVEQGLLAAARAVRFEDLHVLSRDEIAAFGIDRRPRVETPWALEAFSRGLIYKTVMARNDDTSGFRTSRLQLFCYNANFFELQLLTESLSPAAFVSSAKFTAGTLTKSFFNPPRHDHGQETWAVRLSVEEVVRLAEGDGVTVTETASAGSTATTRLDRFATDGLREPLLRLMASCPRGGTNMPALPVRAPATIGPRIASPK